MALWLRSSFRTRAIRFASRRYLHRLGIAPSLLAIQCCERSAQQQDCDPGHSEKRDKHRYGMFIHCALPHLQDRHSGQRFDTTECTLLKPTVRQEVVQMPGRGLQKM